MVQQNNSLRVLHDKSNYEGKGRPVNLLTKNEKTTNEKKNFEKKIEGSVSEQDKKKNNKLSPNTQKEYKIDNDKNIEINRKKGKDLKDGHNHRGSIRTCLGSYTRNQLNNYITGDTSEVESFDLSSEAVKFEYSEKLTDFEKVEKAITKIFTPRYGVRHMLLYALGCLIIIYIFAILFSLTSLFIVNENTRKEIRGSGHSINIILLLASLICIPESISIIIYIIFYEKIIRKIYLAILSAFSVSGTTLVLVLYTYLSFKYYEFISFRPTFGCIIAIAFLTLHSVLIVVSEFKRKNEAKNIILARKNIEFIENRSKNINELMHNDFLLIKKRKKIMDGKKVAEEYALKMTQKDG